MGYQLAVWEGERPADDAGEREFRAVAQQHLVGEPAEPTPAIRKFVAALTEMWTDDSEDPRWEGSPWKWPPILEDASGPVILLDLTLSSGLVAGTIIASLAQEHGLVTFDLMAGMLRPVSEEVIADYFRGWSSSLN